MKKIILGASALLILACQPAALAHDAHAPMALISVSTVLAMKFKNEFVSQATDRGGDLVVACATDHC